MPAYAHRQMWGEWCAYFAGYCIEEGAKKIGRAELAAFRRKDGRPRGGAKELVLLAGRQGKLICSGDGRIHGPILPGDLGSLHRGRRGSTLGHVFIIVRVIAGSLVEVIDGNRGPFPAVVATARLDLAHLASTGKLDKIARL